MKASKQCLGVFDATACVISRSHLVREVAFLCVQNGCLEADHTATESPASDLIPMATTSQDLENSCWWSVGGSANQVQKIHPAIRYPPNVRLSASPEFVHENAVDNGKPNAKIA
jgi:hypothetical protein